MTDPTKPGPDAQPQDVREKIARVLYEQERKRGEHCNSVLTGAMGKSITGASIEPWEECAETFLSDADAVLAVLAQSDASGLVKAAEILETLVRNQRDKYFWGFMDAATYLRNRAADRSGK